MMHHILTHYHAIKLYGHIAKKLDDVNYGEPDCVARLFVSLSSHFKDYNILSPDCN